MANDVPPGHFKPMRSVYLALAVTSTDEAERIYALLAEGGEVFMPIQEHFSPSASACSGTIRHVVDDHPRTSDATQCLRNGEECGAARAE